MVPAPSGMLKIVPALARMAFGLNRSVRGEAAITASAPAPSAERRIAPRLPGFSTASTTTTMGDAGSASSPSSRSGHPNDRHEALGSLPERQPGEDGLVGRLHRRGPEPEPIERGASVGPGQQRLAHEGLDDRHPGVQGAPQLARAVDEGQAGPVALPRGRAGRRPP